ncbi:uncharacterized protein A1O5_12910, partial [Cladophialophora psammophila CBS 110553]
HNPSAMTWRYLATCWGVLSVEDCPGKASRRSWPKYQLVFEMKWAAGVNKLHAGLPTVFSVYMN